MTKIFKEEKKASNSNSHYQNYDHEINYVAQDSERFEESMMQAGGLNEFVKTTASKVEQNLKKLIDRDTNL